MSDEEMCFVEFKPTDTIKKLTEVINEKKKKGYIIFGSHIVKGDSLLIYFDKPPTNSTA